MLKTLSYLYKTEGFKGLTHRINRVLFKSNIKNFESIKNLFVGKKGLEIGGPSSIFEKGNLIPIYSVLSGLDGCNFSASTVWEGTITEGNTYKYGENKLGYQHIADATDLGTIASGSYDVLLSCHSLEHIANPLKALNEWVRVLKPGGIIMLILPAPKFTFDHKRPITTLAHLIDDYNNGTDEQDLTHVDEVFKFHDMTRDPGAKKDALSREWLLNNFQHRCIHHHVFNVELLTAILKHLNLDVVSVTNEQPFHLVAVGRKK